MKNKLKIIIPATVVILLGLGYFVPIKSEVVQGCDDSPRIPLVRQELIKGQHLTDLTESGSSLQSAELGCSLTTKYILYVL